MLPCSNFAGGQTKQTTSLRFAADVARTSVSIFALGDNFDAVAERIQAKFSAENDARHVDHRHGEGTRFVIEPH